MYIKQREVYAKYLTIAYRKRRGTRRDARRVKVDRGERLWGNILLTMTGINLHVHRKVDIRRPFICLLKMNPPRSVGL